MRIKDIHLTDFKRFTDLTINNIPETARLVMLVGPSGYGKSSLFEGINVWSKRQIVGLGETYYYYKPKEGEAIPPQNPGGVSINTHSPVVDMMKSVYVRSAYRHTSTFNVNAMQRIDEDASWKSTTTTLLSGDTEVATNYQRLFNKIMQDVFDDEIGKKSGHEITQRVTGEVCNALREVFGDLELSSLHSPYTASAGTFHFSKGKAKNYDFKNLSGGEKAAFDLLLDFFIKKERFSDAVICIDEPELHMGLAAQGKILEVMYRALPQKSQLWLATHSIGILRVARQIARRNPDEVVFLNFDQEFDAPAVIKPEQNPDRKFWEALHGHVLGDIAGLIAPESIVICESTHGMGFDADCYGKIFERAYPETFFVSAGGKGQLEKAVPMLRTIIKSAKVKVVRDNDKLTAAKRGEKVAEDYRILRRTSIESYLLDKEVLDKFQAQYSIDGETMDKINAVIANTNADDKAKAGQTYQAVCQKHPNNKFGETREEFLSEILAPLITEDTNVFRELDDIIFGDVGGAR